MDFKEATDRLMAAGITAKEIADALHLAPQTIRAMRLDPSSPHHRRPPDGWRNAIMMAITDKNLELAEVGREIFAGGKKNPKTATGEDEG